MTAESLMKKHNAPFGELYQFKPRFDYYSKNLKIGLMVTINGYHDKFGIVIGRGEHGALLVRGTGNVIIDEVGTLIISERM